MEIRLAFERYFLQSGSKRAALYDSLRDAVRSGQLKEGERLPSSRSLAELYGISRGTVTQVYDMLYAEGYIQGERGSGTYVSQRIPYPSARPERVEQPSELLSTWFNRLDELKADKEGPPPFAPESQQAGRTFGQQLFQSGQTDFRLFPVKEWKVALHAAVRECMQENLPDGYREIPGSGLFRLREAVAAMLYMERGIAASPEEIVMTSGSKQGLALLFQILAEPGRRIVLEYPCYGGIREAASVTGAELIQAAVDECGAIPGNWDAAIAALTPNRQFPTGTVLSAGRRKEWLAWAERRGAIIIEDDYDSEFRYSGRLGEPLKAMDRNGRVIYLGSFSRTMYSGLRIGYAVVPSWMAPRLAQAKAFYEPYASGQLEQMALARFIAEGSYAKHLRRMKRQYKRRLAALHRGLDELEGTPFRFRPSDAGLHQYAEWTGSSADYDRLLQSCRKGGVAWHDGSSYFAGEPGGNKDKHFALFGFAHLEEEEIAQGMQAVAEQWSGIAGNGEDSRQA
ncbi:PLP-dependent aminotransferase family protein [Paenibacillus sp. D9]|uniref:MocR-like pyridoxine biosynthesis transcription factor PdxR n=1 Tax=Paenibacillus TaxID=44249 RepID=UPI00061E965B|nr:PLP-dependent aminotransferase family protein [Paenibacillus sp. D9]KKC49468.1 hypothetical protein VE23_24350 [Paenibacillus sp. D9]